MKLREKFPREKVTAFLKKTLLFVLNPRLLLCFGLGWMITNGWSYLAVILGPLWNLPWLTRVGSAYLTLLWLPFTPEKILTCAIAIALLRLLFPRDTATLAILSGWKDAALAEFRAFREKLRTRRAARKGTEERGAQIPAAEDAADPAADPNLPEATSDPETDCPKP